MLRNIYEQFGFLEVLDSKCIAHFLNSLFGKGGNVDTENCKLFVKLYVCVCRQWIVNR